MDIKSCFRSLTHTRGLLDIQQETGSTQLDTKSEAMNMAKAANKGQSKGIKQKTEGQR